MWGHPYSVLKKCIDTGVSSRCPRVGASGEKICWRIAGNVFKSCPRVGASRLLRSPLRRLIWFQVVPPCGGHPLEHLRCDVRRRRFKSCPRVGGHRLADAYCKDQGSSVSSRAPVWGASANLASGVCPGLFQVVPPWGASQSLLRGRWRMRGFKSCPRVGGIHRPPPGYNFQPSFKSCPRVGASVKNIFKISRKVLFQVVPPCGGHRLCQCE